MEGTEAGAGCAGLSVRLLEPRKSGWGLELSLDCVRPVWTSAGGACRDPAGPTVCLFPAGYILGPEGLC